MAYLKTKIGQTTAGEALMPAMLLDVDDSAGTASRHSTAAGSVCTIILAKEAFGVDDGPDTAIASGDTLSFYTPEAGQVVEAYVADGTTITQDAYVVSDGAGGVRDLDTVGGDTESGLTVIGKAVEAATSSETKVKIRIRS